jgi:hypothetical protein
MRLERIRLERVEMMPAQLEPGVLYYSERFKTAAHLCACGCGMKVRTPVKPTFWQLWEDRAGPSMEPSIGNWQYPCRSHYYIVNGAIDWSSPWSEHEVLEGRAAEQRRTEAYYKAIHAGQASSFQKLWSWLKSLFGY